ncbi:uncharacterized protein LOC128263703 [Drosophila gunungcola]|uniref:uncharacterized protein LOC128263703 n=1 Tax=Drosophila gunungcola TaxID=103775 RepID=UPI0022E57685|nr:uncharacterized protein LOC128263703 [Drosophila gunungcola]
MSILTSELFCWTDSTIVLTWLNKPACQWTTFVANRVTKITQSTKAEKWSHVQSEHNPADLASRGVALQELVDNPLWWHGPAWLQKPRSQWPSQGDNSPATELEKRPLKSHVATIPSEDFLDRFSKFDKALRVLAYVNRFIQRCKKQATPSDKHLLAAEISAAERLLILNTQRRDFSHDYHCFSEKRSVPSSSSILSMNPFIDQHGLIRACGRVTASDSLQYDERHPVILPYSCPLSRLLVQFTHRITLHGGNQLMPTSDLTTEKFLAAFAGFVSWRGCPRQVQSDNGKTFVGAAALLSSDFLQAVKESVTDAYGHQQLTWQFIPPGAPHMGGLWEAGVKSFKALFYKSTATRKYNFEELSTLLAEIEACLNSRPLSPMSEDPTELLALTPGHFLVGGPLLSTVEPEVKGDTRSMINRWQHLKALHQQFRMRWKEEYLKELHKRNKWQAPAKNLHVGDMVVIKDENLPSNEWRLGRIDSVFPGADGNVRVVDIRTARGVVKRPITKVVLLPVEPSKLPQ